MNYDKIRDICRVVRISVGMLLIATGVIVDNVWFYLGVAPLIAGMVNFCPLCIITKKCTI